MRQNRENRLQFWTGYRHITHIFDRIVNRFTLVWYNWSKSAWSADHLVLLSVWLHTDNVDDWWSSSEDIFSVILRPRHSLSSQCNEAILREFWARTQIATSLLICIDVWEAAEQDLSHHFDFLSCSCSGSATHHWKRSNHSLLSLTGLITRQ